MEGQPGHGGHGERMDRVDTVRTADAKGGGRVQESHRQAEPQRE